MARSTSIILGSLVAAALMVAALWSWRAAPPQFFDAERPDIILLAQRAGAVAAAALAQTIILILVVGNIYRPRTADLVLRLLMILVFSVSLVSAIALGLAGR